MGEENPSEVGVENSDLVCSEKFGDKWSISGVFKGVVVVVVEECSCDILKRWQKR